MRKGDRETEGRRSFETHRAKESPAKSRAEDGAAGKARGRLQRVAAADLDRVEASATGGGRAEKKTGIGAKGSEVRWCSPASDLGWRRWTGTPVAEMQTGCAVVSGGGAEEGRRCRGLRRRGLDLSPEVVGREALMVGVSRQGRLGFLELFLFVYWCLVSGLLDTEDGLG